MFVCKRTVLMALARSIWWPAALVAGCLLSLPGLSAAQQQRTRTLTYDVDRQAWAETAAPSVGTPDGDLHAIRVLIKDQEYREALKSIDRFVGNYGENQALKPDLLIARAESLIGRQAYHKAHEVLQEFLGTYGGSALTAEALRLEFVIGEAFLGGVKLKLMGLRLLSGEDTGLRILDEISTDYADSPLAELAIETKANHLFKTGDHASAKLAYAQLLREYPRSRYHEFALRRLAEAELASFGGVDYDDAAMIQADERYREYRSQYPRAADREGVALILNGIRETRAQKALAVGGYYERTDHISSAVFYYQAVLKDWPDTVAATKATTRLELLGALRAVPGGSVEPQSNADGRMNR